MDFYNFLLGDPTAGWTDEMSYEEILSELETADQGGFYGCFFAEHHNDRHQSLTSRPGLLIAAAATRTTRLRFGTMVTILGIHHPYFVAEEIATLDVLSSGRIEYGFGAGGFGWRQVGMDHGEAVERVEEGVRVIQQLLLGEDLSYDGRFWSGTDAGVVPAIVQRPLPPFWLSGHSDGSIAQAARLGLNFCTGFVSCETVRPRRARYRAAWESVRGDEPPGKVAHMVLACVGDSRKEVEAVAIPAMRRKLHEFARATLRKRGDDTFTFERALRERYDVGTWDELLDAGIIVYGTVDDCVEQLAEIADTAGEALLVQARFGDLDRSFSADSMGRLADCEVLPKVGGLPVVEPAGAWARR